MDVELEEIKNWQNLRQKLNNSYGFNQQWESAIRIFETRLKNKFFDPLEEIILADKLKGEGFAITTVLCAIIEALASFREGEIYANIKSVPVINYEYSGSKTMFVEFVTSDSVFEGNFWERGNNGAINKNSPFNAEDFYIKVRCGLMHEARTKTPWHINATKSKESDKTETVFLENDNGKIRIQRTILYYRLVQCKGNYCNDLRKNTQEGEILRRFFARKLDHLFDIQPELAFDWWADR